MKKENILDKISKENSEKVAEQKAEYFSILDKSILENKCFDRSETV